MSGGGVRSFWGALHSTDVRGRREEFLGSPAQLVGVFPAPPAR